MSLDKNRSEIVQSFKNLLKKADEMAIEKNIDLANIKEQRYKEKTNLQIKATNSQSDNLKNFNRLGIKSIKRIPENRFFKSNKVKTQDYIIKEKEITLKLTNIMQRHINYWLKKELPKYAREKLRKHIENILTHLKN